MPVSFNAGGNAPAAATPETKASLSGDFDPRWDRLAELLEWEATIKNDDRTEELKTLKAAAIEHWVETHGKDKKGELNTSYGLIEFKPGNKVSDVPDVKAFHKLVGDETFYAAVSVSPTAVKKYLPEHQSKTLIVETGRNNPSIVGYMPGLKAKALYADVRANTILKVASLMGLTARGPDGAGWVTLECPFAPITHSSQSDRNPSMRVEVAAGKFSRWRCFSCGEGGRFGEVLLTLRHHGAQLPWAELTAISAEEENDLSLATFQQDEDIAPPVVEDVWLNQFKPVHVSAAGSHYCQTRGMSLAEMMAWGLRYDTERRRVVFPIRDFNGYLRGAQGRTILPDTKPKYLFYEVAPDFVSGHQFWFNEQALDFDLPIIMVEGPTDAIAVSRVYPNVAAAMGSAVLRNEKLDRLASCAQVVSFFDKGDAGDAARKHVKQWCYKRRLYAEAVPISADLDPGKMTPDQIKMALYEVLDDSLFLL